MAVSAEGSGTFSSGPAFCRLKTAFHCGGNAAFLSIVSSQICAPPQYVSRLVSIALLELALAAGLCPRFQELQGRVAISNPEGQVDNACNNRTESKEASWV